MVGGIAPPLNASVRGHSLHPIVEPGGWRERFREGLPLYLYIARLAVTLFVVIAVVGPVKAVVYRLFGDHVDFLRSTLDSLELGAFIGAAGLGATVAAAVAGHYFWRRERIRPWVLGLAASAGLWGTFALAIPSGFQSPSDVVALLVAWVGFGVLFGYLIYRWQVEVRENAP